MFTQSSWRGPATPLGSPECTVSLVASQALLPMEARTHVRWEPWTEDSLQPHLPLRVQGQENKSFAFRNIRTMEFFQLLRRGDWSLMYQNGHCRE